MEENIRSRVTELQNTIMNSQNELLRLQGTCTHPSYRTEMFMWRVGAFNPSRMCNECDATLAGITEQESKEVYERWGNPTTLTSFYTITSNESTPSVHDIQATGESSKS